MMVPVSVIFLKNTFYMKSLIECSWNNYFTNYQWNAMKLYWIFITFSYTELYYCSVLTLSGAELHSNHTSTRAILHLCSALISDIHLFCPLYKGSNINICWMFICRQYYGDIFQQKYYWKEIYWAMYASFLTCSRQKLCKNVWLFSILRQSPPF